MENQIDAFKCKLLHDMTDFIKNTDCADYSEKQVGDCARLLEIFITAMSENNTNPALALDHVKALVLSLNVLNAQCQHSLIETGQREDICELIDLVLSVAGFDFSGDVTEQWREW
jgi:hypothetical protein